MKRLSIGAPAPCASTIDADRVVRPVAKRFIRRGGAGRRRRLRERAAGPTRHHADQLQPVFRLLAPDGVRIELAILLPKLRRLRIVAGVELKKREVVERVGIAGIGGDRLPEMPLRGFRIALLARDRGEVVPGFRIGRVESQHLGQIAPRLLPLALLQKHVAQIEGDVRVLRLDLHAAPVERRGALPILRLFRLARLARRAGRPDRGRRRAARGRAGR